MEEKLSRKSLNLSVIIPAYNEERRIGRSIELIDDYLNRAGYGYEAIVVDDGSVDGTVSVVEGLTSRYRGIHLLKNRVNHGKGYSIRRGIKHSNGNLILMSDADLSTPIEELEKLLDPIIAGSCQVAIGSRALPGSDVQVAPTLVQRGHGEDIQSIRSGSGLPGDKGYPVWVQVFHRAGRQGYLLPPATGWLQFRCGGAFHREKAGLSDHTGTGRMDKLPGFQGPHHKSSSPDVH